MIANRTQASDATIYFPFLLLCSGKKPILANTSPTSGRLSPKSNPLPTGGEAAPATAGVVRTVRVAEVPGVAGLGPTEHVGARAGAGCTEQVKATDPLNVLSGVTFTVEVDDPPGLTLAGVSAEAETEKSRSNTDQTTTSAEPVFTWQMPVPVQPPVQPVKIEPAAGVGVSVIAVPGA
jgi:hypothetical protein